MTSGKEVEIQLSSPSIMMLALKVIESSPTTGPISGKAPVVEASLVQVSSLLSESDEHDIGSKSAPYNASELLHVAKEEMQMAPPESELLFKEIATDEGIFSFPPISLPIKNIDNIMIICLSNLLQGLPLQLKVKPPQISLI